MSVRKTVTIHCDALVNVDGRMVRCDAAETGEESEPADIVRYKAAGNGWTCDRSSYDYCPEHAGEEAIK